MKVRSPYDEPRIVPWLDDAVVNPGQVVEVRLEWLPNFVAAGWVPADTAAKKAAAELVGGEQTVGDSGGEEQTPEG